MLDHRERIFHAGLVLTLEAALDPPEHIGCQRRVTNFCELFGNPPNVVVDPKDLLKQQDAWTSA